MATRGKDNVEKGFFNQDPFVERLRLGPSAPPSDVVILEGLAGISGREGWVRLYFNRMLTYYAEFRREDQMLTVESKTTRVGIRKDAVIEYTRIAIRAQDGDHFDLDIQLAAGSQRVVGSATIGCTDTCQTYCYTNDEQQTCHTCQTNCETCQTCQTCHTCQTYCHTNDEQQTCHTCITCHEHQCVTYAACM